MIARGAFAMCLLLAVQGCDWRNGPETDTSTLIAADRDFNRAVAAKDSATLAKFYMVDAVYLPMAEPLVRGSAAIGKEWQHTVAIPGFKNVTVREGAEVSGRLGYTWGTYRSRLDLKDGTTAIEPGKWLTVWRKQDDGRWLIVVDTYNTDIMPPDHK
jgi:ketosteroid isomerase-like protein